MKAHAVHRDWTDFYHGAETSKTLAVSIHPLRRYSRIGSSHTTEKGLNIVDSESEVRVRSQAAWSMERMRMETLSGSYLSNVWRPGWGYSAGLEPAQAVLWSILHSASIAQHYTTTPLHQSGGRSSRNVLQGNGRTKMAAETGKNEVEGRKCMNRQVCETVERS